LLALGLDDSEETTFEKLDYEVFEDFEENGMQLSLGGGEEVEKIVFAKAAFEKNVVWLSFQFEEENVFEVFEEA
jgi:shikimate kinase